MYFFLSTRGGARDSQRMRKRSQYWRRSRNLPVFNSESKGRKPDPDPKTMRLMLSLRCNKRNKMP